LDGVSKILPLGDVTEFERKLIDAALPELATNIEKVLFLFLLRCPGDLVWLFYRVSRSSLPPSCN